MTTNEQKLNQTLLILKSILPILEQQAEAIQSLATEMQLWTPNQMRLALPKTEKPTSATFWSELNEAQKANIVEGMQYHGILSAATIYAEAGPLGEIDNATTFYKALAKFCLEQGFINRKIRSGARNPTSHYHCYAAPTN